MSTLNIQVRNARIAENSIKPTIENISVVADSKAIGIEWEP